MIKTWFMLIILYCGCETKSVPANCPKYCDCDMYENYRRATCRMTNWVTIEADLPPGVEILDMSNNSITSLGDHIFIEMGLTSLKLLNLSHNHIKDIHMNAFLDLKKIKTIDLSYNALQRIVINWFWDVDSLLELYLNNNNFGSVGEDPILENKALKVLNISNCQIPYLYEHTFSKLPSLEVLDISGNFLIQLQLNVVKSLANLNLLNAYNMFSECTDTIKAVDEFCTMNGIKFDNICKQKSDSGDKFQRMVAPNSPPVHKNTWIFEDDNEGDSEEQNTPIKKDCSENNMHGKNLLENALQKYPFLTITIPFLLGIVIGISITMCLGKSCKCRKPPQRRTIKRRRLRGFDTQPLVSFNISNPESTPVTPRRIINIPNLENT